MQTPSKGDLVWDRITERNAFVIAVAVWDDGDCVKLKAVPLSPNYPDGWRHMGEIEAPHLEGIAVNA